MAYEGRLLTPEEQRKIDAVKNLLRESDKPMNKVMLADVERFERQAGMDFEEKVKDLAKDDTPYKDSRLQQSFSAIKRISAVRGAILIDVDEHDAMEAAKIQAFRVLGPLASQEELFKYVEEHASKTTLLSVRQFMKNLRVLLSMMKTMPQYFGDGHGGSVAKDIVEASLAAIKDARAYLKKFQNAMPPGVFAMLNGGIVELTDQAKFIDYLGEGWESDLQKTDNVIAAHNLLVTKNFKK
jgi:hypothetical protein